MCKRMPLVVLVLFLSGAFVAACSDPQPGHNSNLNHWDSDGDGDGDDVSDGEPDVGDQEDVGDGDGPDVGDGDGDGDRDREPRSCPTTMQDSCVGPALGCTGGASAIVQCVSYGTPGSAGYRESAQFSSGAVVHYRVLNTEEGPREMRTAHAPDGERCYQMTGIDEGESPSAWRLMEPRFGSFELHFEEGQTSIECDGRPNELCSQGRLESAFLLPFARPESCEPFQPDDLCSLDDECGAGQGCCRTESGSIRQCLDLEFCISQRDPVPCQSSADCSTGERCSRCTRSGIRECVPTAIAENPANTLGCVSDGCQPGDGTCTGDRICCEAASVYQCLVPQECASAPDPNPVCSPTAPQPCAATGHECCYVSQSQEFRCLTNVSFCQTNVCFDDIDCPESQQCCGASGSQSGTCLDSCEPPDMSCQSDNDCFGDWLCCSYPGYSTGQCVGSAMDCKMDPCLTSSECLSGYTCCDEAPLTEGVCIDLSVNQCPPPAP